MDDPQDRRIHERKPLEKDVFCYIAGERLDASSSDISLGGMFIRTEHVEAIDEGGLVGLAFKAVLGHQHPVYLFGRVVRKQTSPRPGVALKWEYAISLEAPRKLAAFVRDLFGIEDVQVKMEPVGSGGKTKCVYLFPGAPSRKSPAIPTGRIEALEAQEERHDTVKTLQSDLLEEAVQAAAEKTAPSHVARGGKLPSPEGAGAITTMVRRREMETPVDIRADIMDTSGGKLWHGRIKRLDAQGLFIETTSMPPEYDQKVTVDFRIETQEGLLPLKLTGPVVSVGAVGTEGVKGGAFELLIREMDEGAYQGVYLRYLKWLHFQELSRD